MRLLVVGAGATGGFYGALAARGGAEVTLVARGGHAAALAERGLTVRTPDDELHVRPAVVTDLDALAGQSFDVVLLTVKAPDLPPLLGRAAALGGVVVTAQNGVDAEPLATERVPTDRLAAAVLFINTALVEPGVIAQKGRHWIALGPVRSEAAAATQRAAELLQAAGVPARYQGDILALKWSKLVWNNAFNVLTALTDRTVGEVARDPALRALAVRMMAEVIAVAAAEGVPLPADTAAMWLAPGEAAGDVTTSTLHDLRGGRPLEHDAIAGTVVRRARAHGVATPVNDILHPLLAARSPARPARDERKETP
jgi:2-dehydropantoate 2-reductase